MKTKLVINAIAKFISGFIVMALLLFWPASTWKFPGAWRLIFLLFVPMLLLGTVLLFKAPELLEKRLNSKEKEGAQKAVVLLSALIFISGFVLSALDFRFCWCQLPAWLIYVGCALFLLAYGLYGEVMRENAYLSRTVEIQEGQKVIDTGLYGIVRHPMYMAVTVLFLSIPLVLGSAVGILPFLFVPALLAKRIKNEEQLLCEGLPGYIEYTARVKYRLFPYIW